MRNNTFSGGTRLYLDPKENTRELRINRFVSLFPLEVRAVTALGSFSLADCCSQTHPFVSQPFTWFLGSFNPFRSFNILYLLPRTNWYLNWNGHAVSMYLFLVKFKRKVPLDFWKRFAVLDVCVFMFIYINFSSYGTLSFVEFYGYCFEFDRYILVEKKRNKTKTD